MNLVVLPLSVTNSYLFRNGKMWALVDTGYAEDWDLFKRRLDEAGVRMADISHVILTHHHDDHVGLLNKLVEHNPSIAVTMCVSTRDLILVGRNDTTHGGGLINRRIAALIKLKQLYVALKTGKRPHKEDNLRFTPYTARTTDIVFSGEPQLHELGIESNGRIVTTPGHTVDSISVFFDDGDCLVGDAAADMLSFAGTRNCVIFVMDLNQYYESWRKLVRAGAKLILPAHGRAFPVERLSRNMGKNKANNMVSSHS